MSSEEVPRDLVGDSRTPAVSRQGNRLFPNEAARRLLGGLGRDVYTLDEWLSELFGTADCEARGTCLRARESPSPCWAANPEHGANGSEVWVEFGGHAQGDSAVRLPRNLTSHRQLRRSEIRWQTLFEHIPGLLLEISPDGTILWVGSQPTRLNSDDVVGKSLFDFLPQESHEWARDVLARMPHSLTPLSAEFETTLPDGSKVWFEHHATPLLEDGAYTGLIVHSLDTTAKKRAESALRESEQLHRELFELGSDAILLIDNETGGVLEANPMACSLYGYSREEWLSMTSLELSAEPEGTSHAVPEEAGRSPLRWHRRKDGIVFPVEITASHFDWKGRRVHFAAIRDVSDSVERVVELEQTVSRLDRALRGAALAVSAALEKRDAYTAGHQVRVAELAAAIAYEMNMPALAERVRLAGSLHDMGKLAVPAEILAKPTKLSQAEANLVKTHCEIGWEILRIIDFGWPLEDVALQHHERLDGSGYPQGLKDSDIILEARVIAVADVVEAMSSHRPYRAALGTQAGLREISRNRGRLYDSTVVGACLRAFDRGFRFPEEPASGRRADDPDRID